MDPQGLGSDDVALEQVSQQTPRAILRDGDSIPDSSAPGQQPSRMDHAETSQADGSPGLSGTTTANQSGASAVPGEAWTASLDVADRLAVDADDKTQSLPFAIRVLVAAAVNPAADAPACII